MWQPVVFLLLPTLLALPAQPECKLGKEDNKPLEVVGTLKCRQTHGTKMGLFFNVSLVLGNLTIDHQMASTQLSLKDSVYRGCPRDWYTVHIPRSGRCENGGKQAKIVDVGATSGHVDLGVIDLNVP